MKIINLTIKLYYISLLSPEPIENGQMFVFIFGSDHYIIYVVVIRVQGENFQETTKIGGLIIKMSQSV